MSAPSGRQGAKAHVDAELQVELLDELQLDAALTEAQVDVAEVTVEGHLTDGEARGGLARAELPATLHHGHLDAVEAFLGGVDAPRERRGRPHELNGAALKLNGLGAQLDEGLGASGVKLADEAEVAAAEGGAREGVGVGEGEREDEVHGFSIPVS